MNHSTSLTVAALVAVVVRQSIHAIEARKDWSAEQKRWIPWICVALGGVLAAASVVAGVPVEEAITLGGGAVGAVVVNELAGARKAA